jgi:hypothetical protein
MGTALAWAPVKPFSPVESLSLASKSPATRSKPIPVIVEPLGDVLVTVNIKVLPTNVQVTVAVEAAPVSTPTIVTVSALALADIHAMTATALSERNNLRNRDMVPPCTPYPKDNPTAARTTATFSTGTAGAMRYPNIQFPHTGLPKNKDFATSGQQPFLAVIETQHLRKQKASDQIDVTATGSLLPSVGPFLTAKPSENLRAPEAFSYRM